MTRYMYDATSQNSPVLERFNPEIVAIYLTGSPDVRWTSTNVQQFPNVKTFVRIDQGGATAPQYVAHVMDVEPGAYRPADVPGWTAKCTAPRPTVYCDRNDLADVMKLWKGDIWLAAPGLTDAECIALAKANPQIVAVQNVFAGAYDKSIVLDSYWPNKPPAPPAPPATTRVQFEYYKSGFGWVYIPNSEVDVPAAPKIRFRASNGKWSGWVEVTPGSLPLQSQTISEN